MFTLFTGHHVEVLQHGGSILGGSVILCETFRRISQFWDNAHSLNLENCLLYLLSTISQFFDLVRCMDFGFIFYDVTPHTLYTPLLKVTWLCCGTILTSLEINSKKIAHDSTTYSLPYGSVHTTLEILENEALFLRSCRQSLLLHTQCPR